jgi:hypothetical protein
MISTCVRPKPCQPIEKPSGTNGHTFAWPTDSQVHYIEQLGVVEEARLGKVTASSQ